MKYVLLFLLLVFNLAAKSLDSDNFPVDDFLRTKVDFWKKVYTVVNSNQGYLHDQEDLSIIYETVNLNPKWSRRTRIRHVRRRKRVYKSIINKLIRKKLKNLSVEEESFLAMLKNPSLKNLRVMRRNIRWQRGMSDRFKQGIVRSGKYIKKIAEIFDDLDVPEELIYLPHVESSFNYKAYSKVGAAGIWQFMRPTARVYGLKVGYVIDQRLDPLIAADAAARLLKKNYEILGAWPLAITAYNHGHIGIGRASRKIGTKDISEIIQKYEGRRFGFASQNFYTSFVAAYEVAAEPSKYFGHLKIDSPVEFASFITDRSYTPKQIMDHLKIDKVTFRELNKAIRPMSFRSNFYLPKKSKINVPLTIEDKLDERIADLKNMKIEYDDTDALGVHVVKRGQSLYYLSKVYKVPLRKLIAINQIANPRFIFPGMKLKVPIRGLKVAKTTSLSSKKIIKKVIKKSIASVEEKLEEPPKLEEESSEQITPDKYKFEMTRKSSDIVEITIETEETFGHLSDWSLSRIRVIKKLNKIGRRNSLRLGEKILVPLTEKQEYRFNLKRAQFHLAVEEDFFENYHIVGKKTYVVKKGDSISQVLNENEIPLWLLRKYSQFSGWDLSVGQKLIIPDVEEKK